MQWHDIAMQEPRRSQLQAEGVTEEEGIAYVSDDGSLVVSTQAKDGKPDRSTWIVWDMSRGQVPAFGVVTFSSAGAAQKAAESWKDSAVTWLALRVAGACQSVATVAFAVSAGVAVRMAGGK